jgi:hypothetical protein
MGRYYNGDIEGKFWFAVQSSTAADRFGVEYTEPNYVEYHFFEHDLVDVQTELARIEDSEGFEKTKAFFAKINGYNDEMLEKAGIDKKWVVDYADWELGKQIEKSIIDTGQCCFDAEC